MKFEILVDRKLDERTLESLLGVWNSKLRNLPPTAPVASEAVPPGSAPTVSSPAGSLDPSPFDPPAFARQTEFPFPDPVPAAGKGAAPDPAPSVPGGRFPAGSRVVIDLRGVTFALPHGTVSVLEFGRFVKSQGVLPVLLVPESAQVQSYLDRVDFFRQAADIFEFSNFSMEGVRRKASSDVLLEITPIRQSKDIHYIVGRVRGQARRILEKHLGYTENDISRFIVALSEICQNIIEHSEDTGYVAIQKYFYKEKLGRNVAMIAVTDLGVGMRRSLYPRLGERFGVEWNDVTAIRQAFEHGVSRHDDPGRGNGLRCVRELVEAWSGKITIRSGTARVNRIPGWAYPGRAIERELAEFPGTQIFLTLPQAGTAALAHEE